MKGVFHESILCRSRPLPETRICFIRTRSIHRQSSARKSDLEKYPIITGHEFSGEIVEVGKGVSKLKVGDLVSVESMHWCGECDACRRGFFNQCKELEEP